MKDTLALARKVSQPVPLFDHGARLLLPFVRLTETPSSTTEALQCIVVLKIYFERGLSMVHHLIVGLVEGVITPGAPRLLSTSYTTFWEDIGFCMFHQLGHLRPAM